MATVFNQNPFSMTASIEEIVQRIVEPDDLPEVDVERILDGEPWNAKTGTFDEESSNDPPPYIEILYSELRHTRNLEEAAISRRGSTQDIESLHVATAAKEGKLRQAIELSRELKIEADLLRRNNNVSDTGLKLASNSLSEGTHIEFLRYTVYDWALDYHDASIPEWARPGAVKPRLKRTHTTKLLEIMDAIIAEHWENYDPNRLPTNVMIIAWAKEKFPNDVEIMSDKVMESICRIIRPDKSSNPSKK